MFFPLAHYRLLKSILLISSPQIAVGTLILLAGVLCLSWRLNTDPTTRPSFSQPPLTPGRVYTDDPGSNPPTPTTGSDEETALSPNGRISPTIYSRPHRRSTSLNISYPRTPISARKGITESEEIWGELEDDTVSPLAPFHQRRASSKSALSQDRKPRLQSGDRAHSPSESTALLARTGTGRSYRDRRRRSTPGLNLGGAGNGSDGRRHSGQQEAVGGWWKMKWWRERAKGKKSDDGA